MVKDQIVQQDESSTESCLHCEINDLVQEYIEGQEKVDIVELAAKTIQTPHSRPRNSPRTIL